MDVLSQLARSGLTPGTGGMAQGAQRLQTLQSDADRYRSQVLQMWLQRHAKCPADFWRV